MIGAALSCEIRIGLTPATLSNSEPVASVEMPELSDTATISVPENVHRTIAQFSESAICHECSRLVRERTNPRRFRLNFNEMSKRHAAGTLSLFAFPAPITGIGVELSVLCRARADYVPVGRVLVTVGSTFLRAVDFAYVLGGSVQQLVPKY